jgi:hypothetical protein
MVGRMSTSAVKFSVSPSFSSVMSTSGWPRTFSSPSLTASV